MRDCVRRKALRQTSVYRLELGGLSPGGRGAQGEQCVHPL